VFAQSKTILELGGGQGWASSIVKKIYPEISVTLTDISEFAIASAHKWEHIFQVKIDEKLACESYEIPKDDSSCDCIFAFAAAHHFLAHQKTLKEIKRVLTSGGHCFYFYEPSYLAYLYKIAYWRVNRKRPSVPENVLIYYKIQLLASKAGLYCSLHFYPSVIRRGAFETVYYSVLSKFRLLQRILPCTINYHFQP
jgi:ubiquinone/menaquinone biosynthesis C-methylase UbiE